MGNDLHVVRVRRVTRGRAHGRALGAAALAMSIGLAGCGAGTDADPTPTTVEVTVTETVEDEPSSPEPTLDDQSSPTVEPVPAPAEDDDSEWFMAANDACRLAIDEYESGKAQAGSDAPPEALALGAASAATRAADTIETLPEPMSAEALDLREAVSAWAAAYRDLALAMDSGTYTEVMTAGDATTAAADLVRAGSSAAPACGDMVHDV
jgi:hypothetical protein